MICRYSGHIDPTTKVECPFDTALTCKKPCRWAVKKAKGRWKKSKGDLQEERQ